MTNDLLSLDPVGRSARGPTWTIAQSILLALLLTVASPASPGSSQAFDHETVWSVGGIDGASHELWSFLSDAAVVDDIIFAVDARIPAIRRFSLEGEFLGSVGGPGAGPGEFAVPSGVESSSNGLLVVDQSQRRITRFDKHGVLVGTTGMPTPATRVWEVGTALMGLVPRVFQPGDTSVVMLWRRDAADPVPSPVLQFENRTAFRESRRLGRQIPAHRIAGAVDGDVAVEGDSLIVHVSGDGVLRWWRANDDGRGLSAAGEYALPGIETAIPPGDASDAKAFIMETSNPGLEIESVVFPDRWPAWIDIMTSEGVIWLREGGTAGSVVARDPERWWRWTPEAGAELGVVLPEGVSALRFIGAQYVVVRAVGDFDVESLQLLRLSPN